MSNNEDELKKELEKLKAENEKLKSGNKAQRAMSMKVSEKGALSVYGMGRFPVTLYKEQWVRLLGMKEEILEFIKENDAKLKVKE